MVSKPRPEKGRVDHFGSAAPSQLWPTAARSPAVAYRRSLVLLVASATDQANWRTDVGRSRQKLASYINGDYAKQIYSSYITDDHALRHPILLLRLPRHPLRVTSSAFRRRRRQGLLLGYVGQIQVPVVWRRRRRRVDYGAVPNLVSRLRHRGRQQQEEK